MTSAANATALNKNFMLNLLVTMDLCDTYEPTLLGNGSAM